VQVTFTYVTPQYSINAWAGSGGTISPSGSFAKNAGDSQAFTAYPNANYVVNQWLVDSEVVQSGGTSYTLPNIQAPHTVQVTFTYVTPQYSINAWASSGGTISPSGSFAKNAGDSQAFTAYPNANYVVNQWLVDSGVVQNGGTSYTLPNIQAPHTVQVTFTYVTPQYSINAWAGSGGTISPSGSFAKNAGDSQAFTASPNANYVVNQWLVDNGVVQSGSTSYTLPNIQAPHTVQVTFTYVTPDTTLPTVSISSPTNGQTFTSSPVTVSGSASDPGTPSSGVALVEVRVNGGSWQPASLWLPNWNRSVSLSSGTNLIEAHSQDGAGNYSTIASNTVTLSSGVPQYTNLGFESASFSPATLVPGLEYEASSALPAWTAYTGTNVQDSVLYDSYYLDYWGISIWDTSSYLFAATPFEGSYTVALQAFTGSNPTGNFAFPSVAIAQTGQIPSAAKSLRFLALRFLARSTDFDVRVGGQTLPYAILSSTSSYSLCGVDVSSFAGVTAELRFTVNPPPRPGLADNIVYLDAIAFSSTPLPLLGTVTTSSSPSEGGTTVGGGSYAIGQVATVVASASSGYMFVNWTERGSVVCPSPNYPFTVNSDRDLVASFTPATYTVTPSAGANGSINPSTPQAVAYGGSVAFTATPTDSYVVDQWLVGYSGILVAGLVQKGRKLLE
jgi:hypothetical protein